MQKGALSGSFLALGATNSLTFENTKVHQDLYKFKFIEVCR